METETTTDKTAPAKLGTVLTEETYKSLDLMISSTDPENHKMAQLILNQCDVPKSIYWIWKLCGVNDYTRSERMVYRRTKASREFIKACDFEKLRWVKANEAVRYFQKKGWLTPEIYQLLKSQTIAELKEFNKHNLMYKVYFELKPEFKYLDPEDKIKELNP